MVETNGYGPGNLKLKEVEEAGGKKLKQRVTAWRINCGLIMLGGKLSREVFRD